MSSSSSSTSGEEEDGRPDPLKGSIMTSPLALLQGTLDVLILTALSAEAKHGYAVSRWIRSASSEAFQVEEGALYPALRRLEARGWLQSHWDTTATGREARFYRLTKEGRDALRSERRAWDRYAAAMSRVLDAARPGTQPS